MSRSVSSDHCSKSARTSAVMRTPPGNSWPNSLRRGRAGGAGWRGGGCSGWLRCWRACDAGFLGWCRRGGRAEGAGSGRPLVDPGPDPVEVSLPAQLRAGGAHRRGDPLAAAMPPRTGLLPPRPAWGLDALAGFREDACRAWTGQGSNLPAVRDIGERNLMTDVPAMVWYQGGTDNFIRWSEPVINTGLIFLWPPAQLLDDRRAGDTPAICGRGFNACMAWRGGDPDKQIWFSRLNQPMADPAPGDVPYTWSPQAQALYFDTPTFPALTTYPDKIFMFWLRTQVPAKIRWSECRGDQWDSWVEPFTDSQQDPAAGELDFVHTDTGVAVVENVHLDQMVMAWRGPGDDSRIQWAYF